MNTSYKWHLALVLALGGLWAPSNGHAQSGFTVEKVMVEDMKAVFATVETADVLTARARIGGTVSGLSVDEGAKVKKGQVIATVVDAKLRLSMDALDARIDSLKSQVKLADTALGRDRKLKKSGIIAQKRLDEAQTNLDVVTRELKALKAERAVISEQQSEGAVVVPGAGRVIKVHATGEAVATIAAKGFILRLALPERHARTIRVGAAITIGADGKRIGYVQQVYPEMQQGRVVADVTVDDLGDFFVGERLSVYIATGTRETIIVPSDYLFIRYGLVFAMVKGEGEVVVQTGLKNIKGTEVLSGLRVGDVLALPETN